MNINVWYNFLKIIIVFKSYMEHFSLNNFDVT